jgi:crotonobetainyl-CoA:carnitine CoA-transferase CaiB-like acyl-CoA transferase
MRRGLGKGVPFRMRKESSMGRQSILDGVVVVDVTNVLAGPYTTYLLTLLGTRTIKIENVNGGDLARSLGASPDLSKKLMGASFIAQNSGKESIAINLKANRGKEIFRRLVRISDVVVENFRPGVMDRLGLGYEALAKIRPDLIYCAVSGFGQDGPDAFKPVYDQIIQGNSGLMAVTGTPETGPLRCGIPIADTVGGLNATLAIVAALYKRRMSGKGCFIDISLLDSLLPMMGWVASNYLLAGVQPERMGNDNFTVAPSGTFETRDGKLNISANKQEQWLELCRILHLEELTSDPRFAERDERKKNRDALREILNEKLSARPAREWEKILSQNGIPSGEIFSLEEALSQPQVEHRKLLKRIEDRDLGPFTVFGLPIKFYYDSDMMFTLSPPPRLGEHTEKILLEIGYSPAEIVKLKQGGVIGCSKGKK